MNLVANHALLAGHPFVHEITTAGSFDIDRCYPLLSWDTDQLPVD